jgi:uncharacterized membrane protein YdjX (TVP38/TMEM64 family)
VSRKARYVVGALVAAAAAGAVAVLPVERWALFVVGAVRETGFAGVLLYALVYVAATLLLLPGSILTAGAGFVYGPLWGALLVSPVSVLGATLAFLLGRGVARGWVVRRLRANTRVAAIDEAVAQHGLRLVVLLRLSPLVPFNLLNYALGLTRVRLRDYVIGSALGMLPGTVLYVYLGSTIAEASQLAAGVRPTGLAGRLLYWLGLAASLLVVAVTTRLARNALRRALGDETRSSTLGAAEVNT